jgi:hypothetical protein
MMLQRIHKRGRSAGMGHDRTAKSMIRISSVRLSVWLACLLMVGKGRDNRVSAWVPSTRVPLQKPPGLPTLSRRLDWDHRDLYPPFHTSHRTTHMHTALWCQLLGMNCAAPTEFALSWPRFCERGGVSDIHADGWGLVRV